MDYRQLMDYKMANMNKNHSEGSIASWYVLNETMSFCESYLAEENDVEASTSSAPVFSLSVVSTDVQAYGNLSNRWNLSDTDVEDAHWCVLINCDEIEPYRKHHKENVAIDRGDHKSRFPNFLREWVRPYMNISLFILIYIQLPCLIIIVYICVYRR